jgi:two-component system, NtrC family, response regulator AtoC
MKVLIADDDRNLRRVLLNELSYQGFEVHEAENGLRVMSAVEKDDFDVVLLDLNMPGMGGMDVLKKMKEMEVTAEVVVLTAHATVSLAVDAMKLGAYDFLTKPFQMEELTAVIEKAFEKKKLLNENIVLKSQLKRQSEPGSIVTKSPLMISVLDNVTKFAASDLSILITGESGVGKELVARAIHDSSARVEGPFIPINCGAIPETMLESELFGHEKGAFTGAHARKMGLLEIASSGTLFLDEIGELNMQLQGKLLRALETGMFFRVGGVKEVKVDVRFVSATNKEIKKEVESGNFRADLYYRISTLTIHIPPLRERKEDIPLLVEYIIRNNPPFKDKKVSDGAMKILSEYAWPGNVRELQNVVQRSLFLAKDTTIDGVDLPLDLTSGNEPGGRRLVDIEKEHILKVFREVNGQKRRAAEILGIDPKTLYRKLSLYGIKD